MQRLLAIMVLMAALGGCQAARFQVTKNGRASENFTSPLPARRLERPEPSTGTLLTARNDAVARVSAVEPVRLEELPEAQRLHLSLSDAIATSLERNTDLVALRASEPVADAAYQVAATYPWNPQFQSQVLPYSRDREGNDGAVSQQHVIVQTFELAGQPGFRTGAAAADWRRVRATIGQAELLNVAQTERLFFTALYLRDLRALAGSLADLNELLMGVIERRMKAGQANSADVALVRLQAQSTRRQQRLAEANFQTALASLRNQLNLDADASLELSADWLVWRWRPINEVLCATHTADDNARPAEETSLRQLVSNRPDVVAARAAAVTARQNLALANASRTPDLQTGPMWQRDESSTQFWGVQAQIDIPVVNTGMPLVRQRSAELRQQEITAERLEDKAVMEARAAVQRYERARWLVQQSRGELSGGVEERLQPVEDQFRAGQISLLQVFAARTSLAQSRQSLLDLLNELAQAAADVTMATGVPPQHFWEVLSNSTSGSVEEVPTP